MTAITFQPAGISDSRWDPADQREILSIVAGIDSLRSRRRRIAPGSTIRLRLSEAAGFSRGMRSTFRALIIRQLLSAYGFDEHQVFGWRLEHKLIQALIFEHYAPGVFPPTCSLDRFAAHGSECTAALAAAFPSGYVIKEALGFASGERGAMDRAGEALASLNAGVARLPICDQRWLVQELVPIEKEYRVHSIEDDVIPDLTFHRFGSGNIPGERDAPNAFVNAVLRRLPDAIVGGSHLAWDVALTPSGEMVVIEVNFGGYHPVVGEGFQCSGYYQHVEWGASMIARLLRFLEEADGVGIELCCDSGEWPREKQFYAEVTRWREMFRNGEYD